MSGSSKLARAALASVIVIAAVFLVLLASVVWNHSCGGVGCSKTPFSWAQALAVVGGVIGCAGVFWKWPEGRSGANGSGAAFAAALCTCVVAFGASFLLVALEG